MLDCYARPDTPFGAKGPMYDPKIGHRGTDYNVAAGTAILAYAPLRIDYVGKTSGLGGIVGATLLDGSGYIGWAHVTGPIPAVGTVLGVGGVIGRVAGWGDDHGTLWDGPHIHTTRSTASASAAANGGSGLIDPAPAIARARAAAAAGGTTPITTEGDPEMRFIRQNEENHPYGKFGEIALVGPGYVNLMPDMVVYNAMTPIYGVYKDLSGDQYHTIIREVQTNRADPKKGR